MPKLADTALKSGAEPLFTVFVWNGERTRRKLFGNYATQDHAQHVISNLRRNGLDAELIIVGKNGE